MFYLHLFCGELMCVHSLTGVASLHSIDSLGPDCLIRRGHLDGHCDCSQELCGWGWDKVLTADKILLQYHEAIETICNIYVFQIYHVAEPQATDRPLSGPCCTIFRPTVD